MPIGPLEIVILLAIVLVIFGARKLPELGRSAGKGVNQIRGSVKDAVGDKADPQTIGRKAGEGVREFREFKSVFKDEPEAKAPKSAQAAPKADPPTAETNAQEPESRA